MMQKYQEDGGFYQRPPGLLMGDNLNTRRRWELEDRTKEADVRSFPLGLGARWLEVDRNKGYAKMITLNKRSWPFVRRVGVHGENNAGADALDSQL